MTRVYQQNRGLIVPGPWVQVPPAPPTRITLLDKVIRSTHYQQDAGDREPTTVLMTSNVRPTPDRDEWIRSPSVLGGVSRRCIPGVPSAPRIGPAVIAHVGWSASSHSSSASRHLSHVPGDRRRSAHEEQAGYLDSVRNPNCASGPGRHNNELGDQRPYVHQPGGGCGRREQTGSCGKLVAHGIPCAGRQLRPRANAESGASIDHQARVRAEDGFRAGGVC